MSSSVVFLLGLIVLSLVGMFVLWIRERGPLSMDANIRAFERELEALSPETTPEQARPRADHRPRGPRPG
jgi:hypothetical protein